MSEQASLYPTRPLTPLEQALVDQQQRWANGERPPVESYLEQNPALGDDPDGLLELVCQEALLRRQLGEAPAADEYGRRFPALAGRPSFRARLGGSLSTEADDPGATAPHPPAASPAGPPAPNVPGHEILALLGRGGMGVVYRARQLALKRTVALKVIRAGAHAGPEERARFRAEAEAVARLQHPNIVQVYEVGEYDGLPFFSLEFCPGGSLAQRTGGNPQPPRDAAGLVETLARAVHAAHEAHVVHRDLKPANVLLAADGTPKVSDFGLAKRLDEQGQTATGDVLGTPSYMAPEQTAGRPEAVGPPSDIYALGAILYELLTGRPPFQGPSAWETIGQVREREPVPPRQLQPRVDRDLETVCLKCLRKEPQQRYASAAALADDLGRWLRGEPVLARPVPAWRRLVKWARRRPARAALAGTAVLAALACVAGGLFYGLYKDQQAALLQRQIEARKGIDDFLSAGGRAEAAGAVAEALRNYDRAGAVLDANPEVADEALAGRVKGRQEHVRRLLGDQAARDRKAARRRDFAGARDRLVTVRLSPAAADGSAGWDEVRRLAPQALAYWGIRGDGPPEAAARALAGHGGEFESPADARQVAAGCFEVLLLWAEAEAEAAPGAARQAGLRKALRLLDAADALARAGGLPAAKAVHARRARYLSDSKDPASASARALADGTRPATAPDFFLTALDAWQAGKADEAAAACAQALQRDAGHFGARYLQALCALRARRWAEAEVGLTACLDSHPEFVWPRLFLATAHAGLGEFDAARDDFALCLRQAGGDRFLRYVILTNRSAVLVGRARWEEARSDLREAIRLRPRAYEAHANLAELHRKRGEWGPARAALDAALASRPGDARLYHLRALIDQEAGDWGAARRDFEQAVRHEPAGSHSALLASAYVRLAYVLHRAGDYAGALKACDGALAARPNFPEAHRQRYTTLLARRDYAAAGHALDQYLAAGGKADAVVYLTRGLVHAKLGEYPRALDAYGRALALGPDTATRAAACSHRGWVYLKLRTSQAALEDFEEALRLEPGRAEALCGRAHARLSLGQEDEAVADAEEAVRRGPPTPDLLLDAACLYARAVGRLLAARERGPAAARKAELYQRRAVDLVCQAVGRVPAEGRAAFWRQAVAPDPSLLPLRASYAMTRLAETYGR